MSLAFKGFGNGCAFCAKTAARCINIVMSENEKETLNVCKQCLAASREHMEYFDESTNEAGPLESFYSFWEYKTRTLTDRNVHHVLHQKILFAKLKNQTTSANSVNEEDEEEEDEEAIEAELEDFVENPIKSSKRKRAPSSQVVTLLPDNEEVDEEENEEEYEDYSSSSSNESSSSQRSEDRDKKSNVEDETLSPSKKQKVAPKPVVADEEIGSF
jgi:hypothetical protein